MYGRVQGMYWNARCFVEELRCLYRALQDMMPVSPAYKTEAKRSTCSTLYELL